MQFKFIAYEACDWERIVLRINIWCVNIWNQNIWLCKYLEPKSQHWGLGKHIWLESLMKSCCRKLIFWTPKTLFNEGSIMFYFQHKLDSTPFPWISERVSNKQSFFIWYWPGITRSRSDYVSRGRSSGDCISRVTQIRLTSPESSKPDHLLGNKITQPLTSPELLNQTIHPPSYKKFWHTCIITPGPPCAKVPKLICISWVVTWVEG